MKIYLSEEFYNLAKSVDFSDISDRIIFNDQDKEVDVDERPIIKTDFFGEKYEASPITVMLGCISDEVINSGMSSDQQKILPRGKALYNLYDNIYDNLY